MHPITMKKVGIVSGIEGRIEGESSTPQGEEKGRQTQSQFEGWWENDRMGECWSGTRTERSQSRRPTARQS